MKHLKRNRHSVQRKVLCAITVTAVIAAALVSPGYQAAEAKAVSSSHGYYGPVAGTTTPASPEPAGPAGRPGVSADHKGTSSRSRVAIIVDDFGNNMRGTEEMFALPVKFTAAVMPFLSTTDKDARRAHELGLDVLVHLPMEPRQGKPEWLGPGAVLTRMSDAEIRQKVEAALDNVPYAIGINNHMGSKVTGDERVMGIVLAVCKERGLFFVDSHTNYRSVAGRMAREMGLPPVENHIFLDDVHSSNHVAKQLKLVEERALEQRYCITIGHVGIQGKETAAGIRSGIAQIKDKVEFVGISELVRDEWKWNSRLTLP